MTQYDAFISYSHSVDGKLAPAIQGALHSLGRPWYKFRMLSVFRDKTNLAADPGLWSSIERALSNCRWFIYLASPSAARSHWVEREVGWWLANRGSSSFLVVLTEGTIAWDHSKSDFDWNATDAIPARLMRQFSAEPLWVDLRWAKSEDNLSVRHSGFRDAILNIAAPLHGRPKDQLDGEDVRRYRRNRHTAVAAIVSLALLSLGSSIAAYLAIRQSWISSSRALAAAAIANKTANIDLAALLAVEARRSADTYEARNAALATLQSDPALIAILRNAGYRVAFGSDDKLLALATAKGQIRLWDLAKHRYIDHPLSGHSGKVIDLAFSPNGRLLASAGMDKTVRLWDIATHNQVGDPLIGHSQEVRTVAFSPDGKLLASTSSDGTAWLWDIGTHKQVGDSLTQRLFVDSAVFSPDGKLLATGGSINTVLLWDVVTHQQLPNPMIGNQNGVAPVHVVFSPDGKLLASTDRGSDSVRIWDVATHRQSAELTIADRSTDNKPGFVVGGAKVTSISFNHDGRILATGEPDSTVRWWDLITHKLLARIQTGFSSPITCVTFSSDGRLFVAASQDESVRLWDMYKEQSLGDAIVAGSREDPNIGFKSDRPDDGTVQMVNFDPGSISSVAFNPDGSYWFPRVPTEACDFGK